eukprot:TRINITY_DN66180_c2_g9_i1.p1 TRINITY_DN66180_c2_g9~~TRINITY_DN66180_c2_g9_i1.p1  ORF type:complete len:1007 (-),score=107.76 TRINITY_DN66180_c2_g9_i1:155-3154(-)
MQLGGIVEYRLRYVERLCHLTSEKNKFKQQSQQEVAKYHHERECYIQQQKQAYFEQSAEMDSNSSTEMEQWLAKVEKKWQEENKAEHERLEQAIQIREEQWKDAYGAEQARQRDAEAKWQAQINDSRTSQGLSPIDIEEVVNAALRLVCGQDKALPTEDEDEIEALRDALQNAVVRLRAETPKDTTRTERQELQQQLITENIELKKKLAQQQTTPGSPTGNAADDALKEVLMNKIAELHVGGKTADLPILDATTPDALIGQLVRLTTENNQLKDQLTQADEYQTRLTETAAELQEKLYNTTAEKPAPVAAAPAPLPNKGNLPTKSAPQGLVPDPEDDDKEMKAGSPKKPTGAANNSNSKSVEVPDAFKDALRQAILERAEQRAADGETPPDTAVLEMGVDDFADLLLDKRKQQQYHSRRRSTPVIQAPEPPEPGGDAKPPKGVLKEKSDEFKPKAKRPFSGIVKWRENVDPNSVLYPGGGSSFLTASRGPSFNDEDAEEAIYASTYNGNSRQGTVVLCTPPQSNPPSAPGTPVSLPNADDPAWEGSIYHSRPTSRQLTSRPSTGFTDKDFPWLYMDPNRVGNPNTAPKVLAGGQIRQAVYNELKQINDNWPTYPKHLKNLPKLRKSAVVAAPDEHQEPEMSDRIQRARRSVKLGLNTVDVLRHHPPPPPWPCRPIEEWGKPLSRLISVDAIDLSKPPTKKDNPKYIPQKEKWQKWSTPEGKDYYHDTETKKSVWTRPPEMDAPKNTLFTLPQNVQFTHPPEGHPPFTFAVQRKSGYIRLLNDSQTVDSRLGQGYCLSNTVLPTGWFELTLKGEVNGGWIKVGLALEDFADFTPLDSWGFFRHRFPKLGTTWLTNTITVNTELNVRIVCNTNSSTMEDNGILILIGRKIVYKCLGIPIEPFVEDEKKYAGSERKRNSVWLVVEGKDSVAGITWAEPLPPHMNIDMLWEEGDETAEKQKQQEPSHLHTKRMFNTANDLRFPQHNWETPPLPGTMGSPHMSQ